MTTQLEVEEWLTAMYEQCAKITPRGATQFSVVCDNFSGRNGSTIRFNAYNEHIGHTEQIADPLKTIAAFQRKAGIYTPEEQAARKREQAAKLLAEAEKLESQTN